MFCDNLPLFLAVVVVVVVVVSGIEVVMTVRTANWYTNCGHYELWNSCYM